MTNLPDRSEKRAVLAVGGRSSRSGTSRRSVTGSGVEDGRRVPDPSHQDFNRPGPPANPFLGVATPSVREMLPEAGERLRPWTECELSGYEPECHDQLPGQNATAVCPCCRAACLLPPSQSCHALAACTTVRYSDLLVIPTPLLSSSRLRCSASRL
ncbi:uncharacterized protein LOC125940506 [Dermacentor silvarum]|uniref:uncharacterized protein LOC125940506 n=1 Tax=Dermacentor silvarum TaxID=543639 RepID=UPI002100C288|nr:uncharacterized protein LOC125940506 [Dermacentor silvarum]